MNEYYGDCINNDDNSQGWAYQLELENQRLLEYEKFYGVNIIEDKEYVS